MRFLGAWPAENRLRLYGELQPRLSAFARAYWDRRPGDIAEGVIHVGKFERYFHLFRRTVLPLTQSPSSVRDLLSAQTLADQQQLYESRWDNLRWRAMFRLFFSRLLLSRLGRDHAFFTHVTREDIAKELLRRARRGLTEIPVRENFFVDYILTGRFHDLRFAHPWMHPDAFERLRHLTSRLSCSVGRMGDEHDVDALRYTGFYCSDIFEYMTQEDSDLVFRSLSAMAAPDARLIYYMLFVPRTLPTSIVAEPRRSAELFARDRTFFYDSIGVGRFAQN